MPTMLTIIREVRSEYRFVSSYPSSLGLAKSLDFSPYHLHNEGNNTSLVCADINYMASAWKIKSALWPHLKPSEV